MVVKAEVVDGDIKFIHAASTGGLFHQLKRNIIVKESPNK
jgi:hypothetical protein